MTFILEQSKRPNQSRAIKTGRGRIGDQGSIAHQNNFATIRQKQIDRLLHFHGPQELRLLLAQLARFCIQFIPSTETFSHPDFPKAGEYHNARVVLRHT